MEVSRAYTRNSEGRLTQCDSETLKQGQVCAVGPDTGDIHDVTNPLTDSASVSIHIYGGDIGRIKRHAFDLATGDVKEFISGYVNAEAMFSTPAPT
jgi:predicted metal-dependent enzyme (double-stranded beta helix superfamily)